MANTSLDIRQSQTRILQDQINSAATTQMDSTLASINNELTPPGRLIAASTPSLIVTVGSGTLVNPNTSKNRILPFVSNSYVNFTGGTITFPSGTGTITVSPGVNLAITIGASQFMAITVQLDSTGNLNLSAGTATGSLATALAAASPGSSSFLSLGLIVIQTNGSSVIQNVTNAMLYQFGSGTGGSGSGGSGLGDDLASLQFQADIADTFPESPTQSSTTINNSAGFTNASYNAGKNMYAISYDASKTATTAGTAVTMSGTPGYTVVAGDVLVNQSTGEVKKITVVTTQTSYTIESAFATNLASAAVTVSQTVHTKDVYNLAVDSNGNTLASAFAGATFSEVAVFYKDNSTAGSNQWAVGAVNVAYSASPDNSSWTTLQAKVTGVSTNKYTSTILSSAGTSLYVRFFADKTSGSGVVNLIMYKAYMQKAASSAQGGILWSAYGTTNNSTTPIGCTIATSGGTTKVTLTGGNQYAVGVNSGQTYGSVDVYLNGQLLPRYVAGSVPLTDGYYTEVSGTIIQLDRDYSSQQLEIQIVQRTQVVDSSTTNTTQLSAVQEFANQGFQGFVNQTSFVSVATANAGTPVAGTFYSSVVGRASMADLSQDLRPRMGIERLSIQQIYQVQNEFGPNGEQVWATPNDLFGQIRLVGSWSVVNGTSGIYVTNGAAADFIEITFYGTGLDLVANLGASSNATWSIDGGSPNSITPGASVASTIQSRNYSPNQVFNLTSNQALGVHTVKLSVTGASGSAYSGFQILNESSSVKVNSGISYVGGQKLTSTAQSSFSYSAPVSGTRGGRVLVYQKSDGTIGSAFTAAGSQNTFSSADHTNEEMVRPYDSKEFGASRGGGSFLDDFSNLPFGASSNNASFTLDDGTSTLVGSAVFSNNTNSIYGLASNTTSGFVTVTFVGTGLDVLTAYGVSSNPLTVTVDGTSIGTLTPATSVIKWNKVVSGLPYGTHVVKFLATAAANMPFRFAVYQPKKPALPAGAIELADYNVMANFVANSTAAVDTVAAGVLRKAALREFVYSGTWVITQTVGTCIGGFETKTSTSTNYVEYTFFGTGFEYRGRAQVAQSATNTVALQSITSGGSLQTLNSTNFPGLTTSSYGGYTFTYASGNLAQNGSTTAGSGFSVSGLTLGVYKIRVTNGTSNEMHIEAIDVISPIHSTKSNVYVDIQNTLPVGSNAISDNRKITPVKDALPSQKAWAQAVGITGNPSTTSTNLVPLSDMSLNIKTTGGALEIAFEGQFLNATAGRSLFIQLYVDGVAAGPQWQPDSQVSNDAITAMLNQMVPVSPGPHKVDIYWATDSASFAWTARGTLRLLKAKEI